MRDRRIVMEGTRLVAGPDGTMWRVYERRAGSYDQRPSLIFESETVVRRVRQYPETWRLVESEELYRLSLGR